MRRRELLPELISDILLRLPARSLLRFRCISNSVGQEIDSPNFAQFHLNRSIETRSHRKVIFEGSDGIYAVDYDAGVRNAVKFNPRFTDKSISIKKFEFGAIQTCYGLILFRAYNSNCYDDESGDSLLLWNPTTRRFKLLPPCPFGIPCLDSSYGLGYDSAAHDYKVVCVYTDEVHHRFCVFRLKSNCWGQTQDLDNESLGWCEGFANGFLYFKCFRGREKVACFDMANEVFINMANGLLDGFEEKDDIHVSVAEDIVILHKNCEGKDDDEFYSVAAVDGNWSKTLMFKWPNRDGCYHSEEVIPLAFSKDGAYVLLGIGKHLMCIYWYNIEKKTMLRLKCSRDVSDCCVLLGESLVSLDNRGIFQVRGKRKRTTKKGSGSGTSMVLKVAKQHSLSFSMQRSLDTEEDEEEDEEEEDEDELTWTFNECTEEEEEDEEEDELVRTFNEFTEEEEEEEDELVPPLATSTQPAAASGGNTPCTTETAGNTTGAKKPTTSIGESLVLLGSDDGIFQCRSMAPAAWNDLGAPSSQEDATKPCTTKTAGNTTRATKRTTSKAAGSNKGVGGKAKAPWK